MTDDRMVEDNNDLFSVCRAGFPVDTSAIPLDAIITGVTFNVYLDVVFQPDASYSLSLVKSTQASTSVIDFSDFSKLYGTLDSDTKLNTADLVSTDLIENTYAVFTLNADGLAYINRNGFTKLAVRSSADLTNTPPAVERQINCQYSNDANPPYLEVTYTSNQGWEVAYI